MIDEIQLLEQARAAAQHAYAPYSGFQVGAALQCGDGRIYTACNVENASYGLSMCAERNAVMQAIADGNRDFKVLAVAGSGTEVTRPCGACRQVLVEFDPKLKVVMGSLDGDDVKTSSAARLLPHAFHL